ncbi:hypothetical protein TNCV_1196801 [Trichonephila clavipes]|uniref:Uncharacterized protein n=1 Tax=Trichonephila clavipes TaxID=2585209 RepID=A0A8X6S3F6_TRICX|nr:hypothetical protein TNCV_1196801 [Trichonephila clavipes]
MPCLLTHRTTQKLAEGSKISGMTQVAVGIDFHASITAEVSADSEDGRFGWLRNLHSNSPQRYSVGMEHLNSLAALAIICEPLCTHGCDAEPTATDQSDDVSSSLTDSHLECM